MTVYHKSNGASRRRRIFYGRGRGSKSCPDGFIYYDIIFGFVKRREVNIVKYTTILSRPVAFGLYKIFP